MKKSDLWIYFCFIPFLCVLPVFTVTACSADQASSLANQGVQTIGQSIKDLPQSAQTAAPYLQEDLEKLWNNVAGGMQVYGEQVGISAPQPALAEAELTRERLIAGASFDDVVAKAATELTPEDLKEMPTSDLSALNGILPFEIDLSTCGENLAEVLNNLDIGQVSAVLRSEAGYHLIQLLDRDGAKVKIGHIVFQVDPSLADQASPSGQVAETPGPVGEAIERLTEALDKQ